MENFVQQYLSTYYYIKTSEVGNDGIYYVNDDRRIPIPYSGSKLIKEIVTVFGLDDVDDSVKIIINDWAVSIKPDVDLEFYWTTMEDLFAFPMAHQIASTTIAMDLVTVQPMDGPRGELMYMDFQFGELDHPTPEINITVNDRDDSIVQRTLEKWKDIIGISSRKFGE
jgi:hypothetical protein